MPDLNERIAARRNELEREKQNDEAFRRRQEDSVIDSIMASLAGDTVAIEQDGDDLTLKPRSLPTIDVEGLKRQKLAKLLKREARKRWTPMENWIVIGCIVAGICLLHFAGFGLILLAGGLWQRYRLIKKYAAQVRIDYPHIFDAET